MNTPNNKKASMTKTQRPEFIRLDSEKMALAKAVRLAFPDWDDSTMRKHIEELILQWEETGIAPAILRQATQPQPQQDRTYWTYWQYNDEIKRLKQQRDELLAALESIVSFATVYVARHDSTPHNRAKIAAARAAIANATKETPPLKLSGNLAWENRNEEQPN